MIHRLLKRVLFLSLFLLNGCPGSTPTGPGSSFPAGPPAPIAEIPSLLRIPENLSINVDKTRSATADGALSFLVGPEGEFSGVIGFTSDLVFVANSLLEGILKPLHPIEIPVSETRTEMDTSLAIGTTIFSVHLDFKDFDLNGDGVGEGCSGHTAALPICMRVWIDNGSSLFRLLAARFDAFPTEFNPGAGSIRGMRISFFPPPAVADNLLVAADYDHTDPENKFTDSFFGFLGEGGDPERSPVPQRSRAFASQLGPDPTALKTTNGNTLVENEGPFGGPAFGKGLGRWLEGDDPARDFWSGSFSSNFEDFRDICARISDGAEVDQGICQNLGIHTEGLDFLDFASPEDLLFFEFPPHFDP